jgi:hypothetical protein
MSTVTGNGNEVPLRSYGCCGGEPVLPENALLLAAWRTTCISIFCIFGDIDNVADP